jgi:hypothetical protein
VLSQGVCREFDDVVFHGVLQVGEHLLSLVQELEAFAASDALPDLLRVQGGARALTVQSAGWQALKTLLEVPDVRATLLLAAVSLGRCSPSAFANTTVYRIKPSTACAIKPRARTQSGPLKPPSWGQLRPRRRWQNASSWPWRTSKGRRKATLRGCWPALLQVKRPNWTMRLCCVS